MLLAVHLLLLLFMLFGHMSDIIKESCQGTTVNCFECSAIDVLLVSLDFSDQI